MNPVELIQKKRDGGALSHDELEYIVGAYTDASLPDYQMSAFLMACTIRGMTDKEMHDLTSIMLHTGTVLDLRDVPGVKVDKHSTGGVGDKVSILIAPIVAACGIPVPMISGRGLGHTGGTLDKLESIPGFRTDLDIDAYRRVVRNVRAVMIGQTSEIAPADKRMYALRDVTATVECIPLIASSIMSKKLAAGIDAIVLDVKTGRGALMQDLGQAKALARALVQIGTSAGKRTIAFVTDMNQPIGACVGNWLEVRECVACLRGERSELTRDLMDLTTLFAGTMIWLGGGASTEEAGKAMAQAAIDSGNAFAKLREIVTAQGGDRESLTNENTYPPARHVSVIRSERDGFVQSIDAKEIGIASVLSGAGRMQLADSVDPTAGIVLSKKMGMPVVSGEPLATVHSNNDAPPHESVERVRGAFVVGPAAPEAFDLVKARIE